MDNTILKKLRCYWLPLLWAICIIATSVAAFNTGESFIVIAGVFNLVAGIWAMLERARAWSKELKDNDEA